MKKLGSFLLAILLVTGLAGMFSAAANAADIAKIEVSMRGIITIANAEGETLIFNSADESINGSMEVLDSQIIDSAPGSGDYPTITFTVPSSGCFSITSSVPEIDARRTRMDSTLGATNSARTF